MKFNKYTLILIFFAGVCGVIHCFLKATPQRVNVKYVNPKYFRYANMSIKRYGRKSDYYINFAFHTIKTLNNNVTVYFQFYEFLHNEYRRSFVEVRHKLCDMILFNDYFGSMLVRAGLSCPITPGEHSLRNMSVPMDRFPNVWPLDKTRMDVFVNVTGTPEIMFLSEVYVLFTNTNKNKKN